MNTKTVEVGGREYVVYRRSTQLMLDAIGMDALALSGEKVKLSDEQKIMRGVDVVRKVLRCAMINPRLSDEPGEGVVTWYELGDDAFKIYEGVMDGEEENFIDSQEQTEVP